MLILHHTIVNFRLKRKAIDFSNSAEKGVKVSENMEYRKKCQIFDMFPFKATLYKNYMELLDALSCFFHIL